MSSILSQYYVWFVSLFMWPLWLLKALTRKKCQFEFYDVVCRAAVVSHINISQEFIVALGQELILSSLRLCCESEYERQVV